MKLSQKLLGLAGLAMADYACCPYDDYGMPDPLCAGILREKTPFEGSARWMDNECKAWESNVDATYEGNPIGGCAPDNWGSCGFQRHFPWRILTATETTALSLDGFTQMDITLAGAPTATAFDSGNVGGSVEVATEYNLGGRPFLGGMCKLFVPVARANIVQVQIAGVHKQGPSYAQYPAKTVTTGADIEGTAYCFSVANVAETRDNTNAIANGNVAGEGQASPLVNTGRTDLFTGLNSLERQVGVSYGITYGATLTASLGTDEAGEVKAGNNFDVVAHFDDTFCETNWGQPTDMQMAGDEGAGTLDYPLNQASGFSHAHTDIMDKRHNAAGYGGLYSVSNTDYLARNAVGGEAAIDNVRWPNTGAWAGFYSYVVCVNSGQSPGLGANVWGTSQRTVAMSVSASDYRVDTDAACTTKFANFRFNLRQVGSDIELCGPGQLPDGDTNKRCTWNWNYDASADFGASNANDPEGFFDRSEQMTIDSWVRKRRGAVSRTDATANNVAAVLKKAKFDFEFRDQDGATLAAADQDLTSDVGALMSIAASTVVGQEHRIKADMTCTNANAAAQRDNFPTCFTGDEIHFNLAYKPASLTSVRAAVSPWFSTVTVDFSVAV